VSGRLDFVDGMLFPSICDVIRNLSGMWKMMFPSVYVRYFDVPQNYRDDIGGNYYVNELAELRHDLGELRGKPITDEELNRSIEVYNENRRLVRELYAVRARLPWQTPAAETYLVLRAGMVLPVEAHSALMRDYLAAAAAEERPRRDNCRIVLTGVFCEQPPLNLIKSLELAGCYVVDDDLLLVTRWLTADVAADGDPLRNLARAFLHQSESTAAKYEPNLQEKGQHLVRAVRRSGAEGVIFACPSFCDPALLERPMLQHVLNDAGIPHIAFKYAENSGQMQPIREQAGTFSDSIKLWSGT
jgi:benzoyl-CoA reductase subunit C